MALFRSLWGGRMTFFEDFAYMQLSKLCFPPKAGSTISKKVQKLQEEGVLSYKMGKKKADDARKRKKQVCCRQSFLMIGL